MERGLDRAAGSVAHSRIDGHAEAVDHLRWGLAPQQARLSEIGVWGRRRFWARRWSLTTRRVMA